jgi:hypothetical protein
MIKDPRRWRTQSQPDADSRRAAGQAIIEAATRRYRAGRLREGQSIVEFAIVLPILIALIVVVADLGRVFGAGVIIESATRNGAEAGALEYERNPPGDPTSPPVDRLTAPAPAPGSDAYYDDLHQRAARVVCADMRGLPNSTFDDTSGVCPTWPVIRVCVRDGVDPRCGAAIPNFNPSVPTECADLAAPWTALQEGQNRDVEVRTCYPFTPLLDLPLLSFTATHLQRTRVFSVPCYLDPAVANC